MLNLHIYLLKVARSISENNALHHAISAFFSGVGYQEIVDFEEFIGYNVCEINGTKTPTTWGDNTLFQKWCSYCTHRAAKMNLFTTKKEEHQIKFDSLEIKTPLGDLFFDCEFSGKSLRSIKSSKIEAIDPQTTIFSWQLDDCILEFLKLKFTPKLPPGLNVDDCMCGLWRINALQDIHDSFSFSCNLQTDIEGSPEPGEGLECQSFENGDFKLSIGTEDQDNLSNRMRSQDWLPLRFQSEENEIGLECFSKGMRITLPNLLQNERAQVQFIIAWASTKEQEVSTWYAVDQSAKKLLQVAEIN